MPIPTPVQGNTNIIQQARLVIEPQSGEQLLMAPTATAATMSLTTQPNTISPTTGMHLHFFVQGNNLTGSITVAGHNPAGGAITSIAYPVAVAPQNFQGYTEYCTKEAFGTVNASGITISGFSATGQIWCYGNTAAKFLVPITVSAKEEIPVYSPPDHTGLAWKNRRISRLMKKVTVDKLDSALYPISSIWKPYVLVSANPTIAPAHTPSSLLAATTVAATMTLTTGPKAPGQFFIFTPASNSVAGTIVLSGLDLYGNAQSETIVVGANNNAVYSSKRYSALTSNQFTTTGMSVAGTLTVTGVFAWLYTFTNDAINIALATLMIEWFDGTVGVCLPYTIVMDGTFDWQKDKDIAFTSKGEAQDYVIVGDTSATTMGANPFATLPQPTDVPLVSWPGTFYVDDLPSGTPFTSQDGSFLTFKLALVTGQKPYATGDGMQRWSTTTRDLPDFSFDAEVVFQNAIEYLKFKQNNKKVFGVQFQGNMLGSIGSTTYYEYWKWTLPVKYDAYTPDASKNPVAATIKGISEYDYTLGYAYQLQVCCQVPPTYTS